MRSLWSFVAPLFSIGAQTAQLTHAAAVHQSWSSSSAVVEHLDLGASVTTSTHRAGYTHITAPDGKGVGLVNAGSGSSERRDGDGQEEAVAGDDLGGASRDEGSRWCRRGKTARALSLLG